MFNEDCKTKNCNAGCIAQVCTPGENQQRKPVETKEKYFPVTWVCTSVSSGDSFTVDCDTRIEVD